MNTDDAVEFVKLQIKQYTTKPLKDIQIVVLRGCLEGKYYRTIAKENGFSYHYVKEIGSEFWPILSEALGTKVIPRNIRAVIEPTFRTLTVTHQKKPPK